MQMYFVVFYIGIKILFGFRYGSFLGGGGGGGVELLYVFFETKEFIFVWRLLRVEI